MFKMCNKDISCLLMILLCVSLSINPRAEIYQENPGGGYTYEFYYEDPLAAESACNDWLTNIVELPGVCQNNTIHNTFGGGAYRNPNTGIFYRGLYHYRTTCADDLNMNIDTGVCETPVTPDPIPVANLGDCESGCNGTNPINGSTGNKYQREMDYTSSVSNGLRFERYYNSDGTDLKRGLLGTHWRSTYDRTIEVTVDSATSNTVIVNYRPDGQGIFFVDNAGTWSPTIDLTLKLVELKDSQDIRIGWQLTDTNDTVETYDAEGKLISITNRQGQTQTLAYELTSVQGGDDNSDTLDSVTDPFGRTLTFSYYYFANSLLSELTDPDGNIYSYSYDSNANLVAVAYPDETPSDSNDNPTRTYHYEDTNFVHALTGITDETGNRFANWGYDTQGRAYFSEHANGVERSDVVYNADGTTTITNSLGQVRTYHFETHNSVHLTSQIDGDQCVSCGGTTKARTYDANGFVASRTDFNDNVTTYINDARGLELSRTEAVGTPEERTITTEWHADFRLPIMITEPGKIVTFTYDSQGRLLERKEYDNEN
jgi:YD repeat-containing protein